MSRVLKLQQLVDLDACVDQVDLFRRTFGDSVDVTPDLCERYAAEFDWGWAAKHFLTERAYEAYDAAERPLMEAYEAARRPLMEAYEAARRPLMEAYEAYEAYEAARRPLQEAYEAARARTFGELYVSEGAV
jgi:hypothetical protein